MRHFHWEEKHKLVWPDFNAPQMSAILKRYTGWLGQSVAKIRGRCILTLAFLGDAARHEDASAVERYSNQDPQSNENPAVLATKSAARYQRRELCRLIPSVPFP